MIWLRAMLPYPAKNSLSLDHHFHRLLFKKDVLSFEGSFVIYFFFVYIWHAVFRPVGNGMKKSLN